MININFKNVKFEVNKEKRIVVCYTDKALEYEIAHMAIQFIDEHCELFIIGLEEDKALQMNGHYSAKAVCAPEDEWDEELGKRIAYDRLKDKVSTAFFKALQRGTDIIEKKWSDCIAAANNYGGVLSEQSQKRKEQINDKFNT